MKNTNCNKLIIAVLQGDDYQEAIAELNSHGFYATVLNSSGGFLKKKSVTLMTGVSSERLDEAIDILKRYGERTETFYQPAASEGILPPLDITAVPVPVRCGGVVLFVLDIDRHEKY